VPHGCRDVVRHRTGACGGRATFGRYAGRAVDGIRGGQRLNMSRRVGRWRSESVVVPQGEVGQQGRRQGREVWEGVSNSRRVKDEETLDAPCGAAPFDGEAVGGESKGIRLVAPAELPAVRSTGARRPEEEVAISRNIASSWCLCVLDCRSNGWEKKDDVDILRTRVSNRLSYNRNSFVLICFRVDG
jgi:hypothetical protein